MADAGQRQRLEADLDQWLQEKAGSGEYGDFIGLVTGWALIVDRIDPRDEADDPGWYSLCSKPGQQSTTDLGLHEAAAARLKGTYIAASIAQYNDEAPSE